MKPAIKHMKKCKTHGMFFILMAMLGLLLACQSQAPDDLLLGAQPAALIFVKSTNSNVLDCNFIGSNTSSNLYSLTPISPNGQVKNLTNLGPGGAVADPEISYDGNKVIFAMRKNRNDNWNIYEMNVDGSNLRPLTSMPSDEADPVYLPNNRIAFTSNRSNIRDEYERRPVELLHTMDANGGDIQAISFNNSDDFDPVILRDGRLAWTRWEHHGTQNRFPLFATHPDGQATFLLFAPQP